jgi:ADP-heptose:LPS heptosyltransferase
MISRDKSEQSAVGGVLVLRVNTAQELLATDGQLYLIRDRFPAHPLYALVFDSADMLRVDPDGTRFDDVLVFPADSSTLRPWHMSELRQFLTSRTIAVTVICAGSLHDIDYGRQIAAGLWLPGAAYLLLADNHFIAYSSPRAWPILVRSLTSLAQWPFKALQMKLSRLIASRFTKKAGSSALLEEEHKRVKSILLIRLDRIGDLVMTLPAISAVRDNFPNARIDLLIQKSNFPLLENVDGIDHAIEFSLPMYGGQGAKNVGFFEWLRLILSLRRSQYDLAIDFRGDDAARKIMLFSGVRIRAGLFPCPLYRDEPGGWAAALTHPVWTNLGEHITNTCLDLVRDIGLYDPGECTAFFHLPADQAREYLRTQSVSNPFVVVHLFSGDPIKNWLPERWIEIINHLTNHHKVDILMTGAASDSEEIECVRLATFELEKVHNAAGSISLETLPTILAQSRMMVTVDTGPMHIAAALGVPIVALFLPLHEELFYPYGQRDRVMAAAEFLNTAQSKGLSLLQLSTVTVDQVVERIDRVMDETRTGRDNHTIGEEGGRQ